MPDVKLLHQEYESNTKPEYIMGRNLRFVAGVIQHRRAPFGSRNL